MLRLALIVSLALVASCSEHRAGPPNIVLIIGDDHGWPDSGFMGSPDVRTPHLDRLAAEGTVFTHTFTTASVCRPSLMSLLTGLHPLQHAAHLEAVRGAGAVIPSNEEIAQFETLPERLREAGYASFEGGKYWEGTYDLAGFSEGMTDSATRDGGPWGYLEAGGEGLHLGRTTMEPLWQFLEARRSEPFFVWFAPMLPHTPHDAPERFVEPYRDLDLPTGVSNYYANVGRLDERVGELLDTLDDMGLRENTIVVYLSDNGWDARLPARVAAYGGSQGKLSSYELGFRTPTIVSWPGTLPEGRTDDKLVSSVDVVATLLDFASAPPLPDRPGMSLKPTLEGTGVFERDAVFATIDVERNPAWFQGDVSTSKQRPTNKAFVRTREWRLVWGPDPGDKRLYRIDEDPFEERNVRRHHPEVVRALERDLNSWRQRMLEPWLAAE